MWWGLLAFILAISIVVMFRSGPNAMLGTGVLVSLLFPCWIIQPIAGISVGLRMATAISLLLIYLIHPRKKILWSLIGADWAVLALYLVHAASDSWHDGLTFTHFARACGEWSVPYIAGRLAIQSVRDWNWLTGVAVVIATLFSLWATTEATTRVNIANPVFGARPADRTSPMEIRLGLKRAEGPTRDAIWFGMLQTLLLPWTIFAVDRVLRRDGSIWWCVTPICSLCGILFTVTRGPALAALCTVYLTAVFCLPKFRNVLIVFGIVSAGAGLVAKDYFLGSLEELEAKKWGNSQPSMSKVEFGGEQHRYTSMSQRWLVFSAYRPAMRQTGFLGFGTARTSTFPPNVPFGPDAAQTVSKFWSIDCEYLLILLRFGWCGVSAFVAIGLVSIVRIARQAGSLPPRDRVLPLAIAATLAASMLALIVEWMPHDYGFLFLWLCGVANGPRIVKFDSESELLTVEPRHRENPYRGWREKIVGWERRTRKSH